MKTKIASSFDADLAEIINYFVDLDAVETATRFLAAVERTIDDIERFPTIGTTVVSKKRRGLKFKVRSVRKYRNYLIAFRAIESGIVIQRLVYGNRDLANQL